jgi:hypothetical protein
MLNGSVNANDYRFSQDIQLIDKQLPSALQTVLTRMY